LAAWSPCMQSAPTMAEGCCRMPHTPALLEWTPSPPLQLVPYSLGSLLRSPSLRAHSSAAAVRARHVCSHGWPSRAHCHRYSCSSTCPPHSRPSPSAVSAPKLSAPLPLGHQSRASVAVAASCCGAPLAHVARPWPGHRGSPAAVMRVGRQRGWPPRRCWPLLAKAGWPSSRSSSRALLGVREEEDGGYNFE
jgi:hypothetical protein